MADTANTQESEITITPAAAGELKKIRTQREIPLHAVRLFVQGMGCSGLQYGMGFDDHIREDDVVLEQHDLTIVIDPVSLAYMRGTVVGFNAGDPQGAGFTIDNPNAVSGCADGSCRGCG